MESGTSGDLGSELDSKLRVRWNEKSKVYTRRINKKAQKTSINNDSATTTAAENPTASTTSTTENPAATAEVPFSTVAATTFSAENPSKSTASPAVIASSHSATTTDHSKSSDNVVKEFSETPYQGRTSSQTLVSKDADSFQQQQGQSPHQEHTPIPILSEDGLSQNRVQEGSFSKAAELQNPKEISSLLSGNKFYDLKESSPLGSANELLQRSGHGAESPRESSPHPSANKLPSGRKATMAQLPGGYELQNGGEANPLPSPLPSGNEPVTVNGNVKPLVITRDDKVILNISEATPRNEIRELKKKLERELERVRMLFKQLEAKDANINSSIISSNNILTGSVDASLGGYIQPQPQYVRNEVAEKRALARVNSEAGSTGHLAARPMGLARVNSDVGATRYMEPRPYSRQLSVAVENNPSVAEFVEKEKRTPKANQYYRNSEFLLGKDRLPSESNKRLKTNSKRKFAGHGFGFGFGFEMDKNMNRVFRSCSNLLQRLMKHKHGWVFNEPVNAKALGLRDYHDIIKYPMDLGTIKNRLSQNWYKSPREFAEDVRLVFRNAMTYNPKGQDVHVMAEQLSEIFEERWAVIETEYNYYWKYQMYHGAGLPTPTSRKAPPQPHFAPPAFASAPVVASFLADAPSAPRMMTLDRSESVATPISLDPKIQRTHVGRMPVPKKPKAKDPHKRDMTYEEKQRLSKNLQSIPSEKLDAIIQIIKKRNTALSQNDNEIEVDIDTVDTETLWELDRFVTNFKKSLSKYKRKTELALQARAGDNLTVPVMSTTAALAEVPMESGPAVGKSAAPPPVQGEKLGYNASRSSSSSSSSSDSGSSSSDSDSDSSSADGSDEGH
ncbi:transcription factor GTE4-like [Olea europaea subsp. europaea]|uniref:Transcription factor GTE4-like n=1 Tax=Olea europaea subsp. europaea TaxID=158383 RepID=A0A8S0PHZ6_OLEEU|nr:transcription factor GTE4-like [Olea europaea subsp. europaea]